MFFILFINYSFLAYNKACYQPWIYSRDHDRSFEFKQSKKGTACTSWREYANFLVRTEHVLGMIFSRYKTSTNTWRTKLRCMFCSKFQSWKTQNTLFVVQMFVNGQRGVGFIENELRWLSDVMAWTSSRHHQAFWVSIAFFANKKVNRAATASHVYTFIKKF